VTLRGTKAQAQAEAAKILAGIAHGTHVDPTSETVAQFVERWLNDWANDNVANTTWSRYADLLRKHVVARVGSIPIQKLRAADLQAVYAAMAKDGLSDRTRLHTHRVTFTMLKHAVRWGVVARNVASLLDPPRVAHREIEILSPTQVRSVLDALQGKPLHAIATLLLGTGLRRGEALALRWQDLDLDGGALRVEQALEETPRGGRQFKPPKNKHSRRTVTLPSSIVALLRAHRTAMQEQNLAFGLGRLAADALVFPNWDGGPRSPHAVTNEWRKAMRAAGLKASLHSLRHTHASTLIAAGLDVLSISRRLGHASPVLTLSVYGHLFKTDDRAAAIMEAALTTTE
jgi:integrase